MHYFTLTAKDKEAKEAIQERFELEDAKIKKVMQRHGLKILDALKPYFGDVMYVLKLEWDDKYPLVGTLQIGYTIPIDSALENIPRSIRGWIMESTTQAYYTKHVNDSFKGMNLTIEHIGNY